MHNGIVDEKRLPENDKESLAEFHRSCELLANFTIHWFLSIFMNRNLNSSKFFSNIMHLFFSYPNFCILRWVIASDPCDIFDWSGKEIFFNCLKSSKNRDILLFTKLQFNKGFMQRRKAKNFDNGILFIQGLSLLG